MKANNNRNNTIFHLKHGTIEMYEFEPIMPRIALFRLQEMKKIDESEQVIKKERPHTWFTPKKGIVFECDNYILRKSPPKTFKEKEANYLFVKRFINGLFRNASVHVMPREDKDGESIIILNPKDGVHNEKIQLTPDLYLEYLLGNERFSMPVLQEEDLTEERPLFQISKNPVMECDLGALESLLKSGLINGDYDERLEWLEGSTKVYEKLRQAETK